MKPSTANFLAAAVAGLLPRALAQYQGGLDITDECLEKFELTPCPAVLPSRNALLLPESQHVVDETGKAKITVLPGIPLVRASFYLKDGVLVEENTLAVFEMPEGFEDKECTLQFTSDAGTALPAQEEYIVWELEGDGATVTNETTFDNKPARKAELARFFYSKDKECLAGGKARAFFHEGPGYDSPNPTFPCPGPGRFAYELSAVPRPDGSPNDPTNQAAGSGLSIEIVGEPSQYNEVLDEYPDLGNQSGCVPPPADDEDDDEESSIPLPPSVTATGFPSVPEVPTGTGVPAPPESTGGAARLSSFVGGMLMVAGLPLVF